ncbi:uncharacterized protein B0T15DRAFT_526926 [Chaetomium strumarium]|uniref:Uncharacterized protein n=1 Tax=Chaetomium strumarium TaxID=1170767 RepID=A0AAJ0GUH7_9PEZI|nr:hypothetical protein B0T15DRAFT_526926 [Chaetomium strumarium]
MLLVLAIVLVFLLGFLPQSANRPGVKTRRFYGFLARSGARADPYPLSADRFIEALIHAIQALIEALIHVIHRLL